jgi:hypothetical protein
VSRFLPPSTNAQYAGSPRAPQILAVLAVLTIVPAAIHSFLPDGGAGVIAGLDLTTSRQLVVALFHWAGATQLVFGLVMLAAALRYRTFVPPVLALLLVERGLHALHFWGGAPPQSGHRPPEHYALLVVVPLIAVALWLSLRPDAATVGAPLPAASERS